jgi:GNAT superfamily N-acetyltransferase
MGLASKRNAAGSPNAKVSGWGACSSWPNLTHRASRACGFLLLDPAARGLGLGRRLVDECIDFARAAGYHEVVLWTHAVLLAARGIYASSGFQLEDTWTHDEFGSPEVSETWRLKL